MSGIRLLGFYGSSDDLCEIDGSRPGEPIRFSPDLETDTATVEIRVPGTDEGLCVNWWFNTSDLWSLGLSQLREGVPLPLWQWTYGTVKHPDGEWGTSVKLILEAPDGARIRQVCTDPREY